MIVAKTDLAHAHLSKQIADRSLIRKYKALIWGSISPIAGDIDINLARSHKDRTRMTTVQNGGKRALTHYKTEHVFLNGLMSLVECKLDTGRTHQIRVHLSHKGNSIVGDQIYGNNSRKVDGCRHMSLYEPLSNFKRQALHSYYIEFTHPISSARLSFSISIPQDIQYLIDLFQKHD
jgi:23S rRNA pseudouridine1911/1915/1917 synthase